MGHPYQHVAILGGFNTRQARELPGHTSFTIALEAALGVIETTGIDVDLIDGVFGSAASDIGYALGLDYFRTGGGAGIAAVLDAADAIAAGSVKAALIVFGGAGLYTERASTAPWTRPANEWVLPFGLYTAAEFALVARRHMHLYGTTREQMAIAAAQIRNNGSTTPGAVYEGRGPFTPQDILDSRPVADPFHLLDCSTTSEGGAAMILAHVDYAQDLRLPPVRILGGNVDTIGPAYTHPPAWDLKASRIDDAFANAWIGRRAARQAFATGGIGAQDIDVAEFYDPFSFEIIRQLEAYGFCGEGEGGAFVEEGRIALDGQLPITTDGGTMSYSHAGIPQMLQRAIRAVQQVQGVCETNQIEGAETALATTAGSGALVLQLLVVGKDL